MQDQQPIELSIVVCNNNNNNNVGYVDMASWETVPLNYKIIVFQTITTMGRNMLICTVK
jgi:hypothetical protein